LVTLSKNSWPRVLGSVVIQLYAGECTPCVDRALMLSIEEGCREQILFFNVFSVWHNWESSPVYQLSRRSHDLL